MFIQIALLGCSINDLFSTATNEVNIQLISLLSPPSNPSHLLHDASSCPSPVLLAVKFSFSSSVLLVAAWRWYWGSNTANNTTITNTSATNASNSTAVTQISTFHIKTTTNNNNNNSSSNNSNNKCKIMTIVDDNTSTNSVSNLLRLSNEDAAICESMVNTSKSYENNNEKNNVNSESNDEEYEQLTTHKLQVNTLCKCTILHYLFTLIFTLYCRSSFLFYFLPLNFLFLFPYFILFLLIFTTFSLRILIFTTSTPL